MERRPNILDLPMEGLNLFKSVTDKDSITLSLKDEDGCFLVVRFHALRAIQQWRFGRVDEFDLVHQSDLIDEALLEHKTAGQTTEGRVSHLTISDDDGILIIILYQTFEILHNNIT